MYFSVLSWGGMRFSYRSSCCGFCPGRVPPGFFGGGLRNENGFAGGENASGDSRRIGVAIKDETLCRYCCTGDLRGSFGQSHHVLQILFGQTRFGGQDDCRFQATICGEPGDAAGGRPFVRRPATGSAEDFRAA